jgi:hypothetical protein
MAPQRRFEAVDRVRAKTGAPGAALDRVSRKDRFAAAPPAVPTRPAPRPGYDSFGGESEYSQYGQYGTAGPTQKPWRDLSGERQKVAHQQVELEVQDVQDAYDRATSIITKEGGYVDSEDLRVEDHGKARAYIRARVPVENLAGVVAQLRELGKVLKLVGESQDVTDEYYERGADIRGLGAAEEDLVAKYEAEKNPSRKAALYRQIRALREENQQRKLPLKQLSKQTHYAYVDLTLTQRMGPLQWLSGLGENAGTAAGWFAASAVFWLPLLIVLAVMWRRRATS